MGFENLGYKLELKQKLAFRDAILQVKPDYFSWDQSQQEIYRVKMPDEDYFKIKQSLLLNLFHISVKTQNELEKAIENFSPDQYNQLNSTILLSRGIGDNYFFFNEYLAEPKTVLDFNTIYDYAYNDYLFQEKWKKEEISGYRQLPFSGNLNHIWIRAIIDDAFYYITLTGLPNYIISQIEDAAMDKINELIPYKFVEGENHGIISNGGYIHDIQIDANGLERQLKELESRYYRYIEERTQYLSKGPYCQKLNKIYFLDNSDELEPQLDIIFTSIETLKGVRIKTFFKDCLPFQGKPDDVDEMIKEETENASGFLIRNYKEIMER